MKVFVAGATGVVGRRLVPLLVSSGHEVTAVARSPAKHDALTRQGARALNVDLFDRPAVKAAVAGHEAVVNIATHIPSGGKLLLPGAFKENNRIRKEASRNLAEAASAAGAQRFIQESFAAVYPDRGDQWIDETVPIDPARYVETVRDAESAAEHFTTSGGAGVVLRFSFFYGPDSALTLDQLRFVKKGIAPIFGSPDGYVSSLWIDDAASAVLAALRVPGGIYNVTDDVPVRRRECFDALARALGVKPPKFFPEWVSTLSGSVGDTLGRSLRLSNKRFRETARWAPTVRSVTEGWPLLVRELSRGSAGGVTP